MTITTTISTPACTVTVNGVTLTEVISVRTQHGFNLRVAEASIVVPTMPTGLLPWQAVTISMGASSGTKATRFVGFYIFSEQQLYPYEVTLHCRGKLALADTLEAEVNVDMSSWAAYVAGLDDNWGHNDATMVATVLYNCRVPGFEVVPEEVAVDTYTDFYGTGRTLGRIAKGAGFEWREGETGLSFIERLDAVCLGWRTFDKPNGTVARQQISCIPGVTVTATFTEGVDIFRATESVTILEARNKIVVEGYPGQDGKAEIKYTTSDAAGGNPFLLEPDNSQWFMVHKLSSSMIEHQNAAGAVGLSCEEVALWLLDELNVWSEKVILTTPLDTVIEPGDTIAVVSSHLGLSTARNFWVQQVDAELSRSGAAWSQVLTCITGIPFDFVSEGGDALITEDGKYMVSE